MVLISVCIGTSCHLNGAHNVIATFQHLIEEFKLHDKVHLEGAFCMGSCGKPGVSLSLNQETFHVDAPDARRFFIQTVLPLVKV